MTSDMRLFLDIINEAVVHRDRVDGVIVAINPSPLELKANFKSAAGGVLTKSGDFVVGVAKHGLSHPDITLLAGVPLNEIHYHLGVYPTKVIVELWDNFDDVADDLPDKLDRATIEKYTRFPKSFRDAAGRAVRENRNVARAYDGPFSVFVDLLSADFSTRADGRILRDKF